MKTKALFAVLGIALGSLPACCETSSSNVRYVGPSGRAEQGDIGARINAAYASLPPSGGTIVVIAEPDGSCYDFDTPIVAATAGKELLLQGAAFPSQLAPASSVPCLNYQSKSNSTAVTLDYTGSEERAVTNYGMQNVTLVNDHCENVAGCGSGATGVAIGAGDAGGPRFENIRIVGFGTGIRILDTHAHPAHLSITDCAVVANSTGFTDPHRDGMLSFQNCRFQKNGTAISSSSSLRMSNSSIEASTIVGIACFSPAICELSDDHFENFDVESTHFLDGNGIFSVLGGDMRDDGALGTADWWMNLSGSSFAVIGTAITSERRTATQVVLNEGLGIAAFQNASPSVLTNLFSKPNLVTSWPVQTHPPNTGTETTTMVKTMDVYRDSATDAAGNRESQSSATCKVASICRKAVTNISATSAGAEAGYSGTLVVDGLKYTSIQSAIDTLPITGGTVFVRQGVDIDSRGIRISKPVHLIFDVGMYTYSGPETAIVVSSGSGSGIIIEGSGTNDVNHVTHGTVFRMTQASANCLDVQDSENIVIRDFGCVGSGSGSGTGLQLSGSNLAVQDVDVHLFGGDGVVINGMRCISNGWTLERVRSHNNGGTGFNVFGSNGNLGTMIATLAQSNKGVGYRIGTFSSSFLSTQSERNGGVGYLFLSGASGNFGSVYSEPVEPELTAVSFSQGANYNQVFISNGTSVVDKGIGNSWKMNNITYATGSVAHDYSNTFTVNEGQVNVARLLTARDQAFDTLATEGVFLKSADAHSGYTLTERASLNFVYNKNRNGFHARFYNSCPGDLSRCQPVFDLTDRGEIGINGTPTGEAVQGSDPKLLTARALSGVAGNPLCLDANGGADTQGCGFSRIQTVQSGPSCRTAGRQYASCSMVLTWRSSFPDTRYSVTCTGIGPSDPLVYLNVVKRSAEHVTVSILALGAVAVSFDEVDCTGLTDSKVP